MKQITFLVCLMLGLSTGFAQTFNSKSQPTNAIQPTGSYGHQNYNYASGNICSVTSGTVTPVTSGRLDTLWRSAATDTGFVQFTLNGNYDFLFDLAVTKISGTVAGTALLQGSTDNSTWHTLTANTTYCTDCNGASATVTNTTGTKHYPFYLPKDATNYPFYQFRLTSTDTSGHLSYTGSAGYKN